MPRKINAKDEIDQAKEMWEEGKEKIGGVAADIRDEASEVWEKSSKKMKEGVTKAKDYADDHPWQMAAAGAAAGFILAALLFRKRE